MPSRDISINTEVVGLNWYKQEEDSDEYGSPVVLASAIADIIKSRTDALLKKTKTAVSSKPIVMRAEYAHCPNLTIIDTPGFVLKVSCENSDSIPYAKPWFSFVLVLFEFG